MAKWNPGRRLLDRQGGEYWNFNLKNIPQADLMRDIYPYNEVCLIDFDHKHMMPSPCEHMFITDTTFRDGQQARPPYSVKQICEIFDLIHRMGGPKGIIRQSEFFLYTSKDKEAMEKCREKEYDFPQITGWIRAKAEDLKLVKEMGLGETGILTSASDYHIYLKLKRTRAQAMEAYLAIVKEALDLGIVPRCHFEDITRADMYGFCVPFAIELMKLRKESGIDIKIRLCDTLGYGVTYPGAALPRSVPKLVRAMIDDAGVPGELLEWHGHNDFHKTVVNATTAWLYGCGAVNGTLLGFGERTGNTPIEAVLIERIALRGTDDGIDTKAITEMARYFERELEVHIPKNYPLVGDNFNATSAGIHADGLLKNEEIYNIFDTGKILGRPVTVIISDKSGTAGVAHWINAHRELDGEQKIDKRHPGVVRIYKQVMREYEQGRVTSMSSEEMQIIARKHLPELFISEFDKLKLKAHELAFHLVKDLIDRKEIRSMDPEIAKPSFMQIIDENPFIQFLYVVNADGRKITQNFTHLEDRAKYANYQLDSDFSARPWFIEPIKDGKIHVSEFYTSRITGALCITVSGPIRNDEDEIVGILGIDLRFEDLAKMERDSEE
ncbi:MAG: histone-lysine N-methyltransferase [Deltaproteobacteria bacterium]|nr:histone-lysine N-methyltransferase [Deltaproteobacteria bacterium]MBW1932571.1 histone-lysine N-methyltransferase [Deltaproteobacteria bacterium]MBW1938654.1 histone-lysine N-methyltransferase [Deltaproteobacteria bacterium]MBW1964986.1 histone-lysine N-methyltransferase [Deltaproteobacteria bacterium]MBW2351072.1 histone-lysine N-methyltransferase [Deltaproteobacteria bacterium]